MRNTLVANLMALLMAAVAGPALAATFQVPTGAHPTIQAAVVAAAANADAENIIEIIESPVFTNPTITISNVIAPGTLTIRPGPGLSRAYVVSTNGGVPIFRIDGVLTGVTLQDLDIVRNATNANDLIQIANGSHFVTVERCRIGSIWGSIGAAGFSNVRIDYPYDVIIRNCILFSYLPGNFDRCLQATGFPDPANSLFLYNNDAADYRLNGIYVNDGGAASPGALVLLRNNVVVNHPDAPPASEPRCFRTDVDEIRVVKSHNVAFASDAAHVEVAGVAVPISLSGIDNPVGTRLIQLPRADVDLSFVTRTWVLIPPWDPNVDFYRLLIDGKLHNENSDWGQNVNNAFPDGRDIAVHDDIERQIRPGGTTLHTDRGADQIESGVAAAVGRAERGPALLWAAPEQNPARRPGLRFRAAAAGRLTLEVFDLAGRRLHRAERWVEAGETGVLSCGAERSPAVLSYRLVLAPASGSRSEALGRIVQMR